MNPNQITSLTASEIAQRIKERELSAQQVVEAHIQRIEAVDKKINAVIITRFDEARAEAKEADEAIREGKPLGPLHGVPITIKEQFDVEGLETNVGVPNQTGRIAERDGPLVSRLRKAGAIILGKTNVMMTLAGWESDNPVYGRTSSPWNLGRTPGGSSGGESAIIAARGSPLGLGGDLAGSIRVPAHFCGLFGLKPTSGRLTNTDTPGHLFSFGQEAIIPQNGPIARSVTDLKLMMKVLSNPPMIRTSDLTPPVPWPDTDNVQVEGLTVGIYTDNGVFPVSPAIRRAVEETADALKDYGAIVKPFDPPDVKEAHRLYFAISAAGANESIPRTLAGSSPNDLLKDFLRGLQLPRPLRGLVTWNMKRTGQERLAELIRVLRPCSTEEYWKLVERRNIYRERFLQALDNDSIEAIICPIYATVAPPHGFTQRLSPAPGSYSYLYNLLGMPSGVVPVTLVGEFEETDGNRESSRDPTDTAAAEVERGSAGMPVGVQIVSRHWREDIVLKLMETLEEHFKKTETYPLSQELAVAF
ncbi:MAG: amidase [Candidatus Thorarchaeota archaeon]